MTRRSMAARTRDLLLLVLLWAAVTMPFLDKAFHIDDPVHVQQAAHILDHPTRPLDLEIFWFEWPERLSRSNPVTPPVWQYELAAGMAAGGVREPVLNAIAAVHVLVLGIGVYVLAARLLRWPLLAAALVVSSPAAVVGRNLMLDIPMLSYLVTGVAASVIAVEDGRPGLAAVGALLVGIATITKLPAVAVLPALSLFLAGRS